MNAQYFIDANFWIYLNTLKDEEREVFEIFIEQHIMNGLAVNLLVLDEVLFISRKKYHVPYRKTLEFWTTIVSPVTTNLALTNDLYPIIEKVINVYDLAPADAIHCASILYHKIPTIISENSHFDNIESISRGWIKE